MFRIGTDGIPFIFGVQIHQVNINIKGEYLCTALLIKGDRRSQTIKHYIFKDRMAIFDEIV